jgi:hypothetical protein
MKNTQRHPEQQPYRTQVKVSVPTDVASTFKAACAASNVSMAGKLAQFMADYADVAMKRKALPDYSTKRRRRIAIQTIVKQLEQIRDSEAGYRDRIPENLQGSATYDSADEAVSMFDEAIDSLGAF